MKNSTHESDRKNGLYTEPSQLKELAIAALFTLSLFGALALVAFFYEVTPIKKFRLIAEAIVISDKKEKRERELDQIEEIVFETQEQQITQLETPDLMQSQNQASVDISVNNTQNQRSNTLIQSNTSRGSAGAAGASRDAGASGQTGFDGPSGGSGGTGVGMHGGSGGRGGGGEGTGVGSGGRGVGSLGDGSGTGKGGGGGKGLGGLAGSICRNADLALRLDPRLATEMNHKRGYCLRRENYTDARGDRWTFFFSANEGTRTVSIAALKGYVEGASGSFEAHFITLVLNHNLKEMEVSDYSVGDVMGTAQGMVVNAKASDLNRASSVHALVQAWWQKAGG
jgi:hypothetical protein